MQSKFSPAPTLWESVKLEVSKHKILISISVALVFIIAISCIEISQECGAIWTIANNSVDPNEPPALAKEIQEGIYFATYGGTVNFFSSADSSVKTIYIGDEDLRGITYDPVKAKLYWSSNTKIYRGNMDGSEVTMVLNTTLYGEIKALAFDWITGNTYGVCWSSGVIFACNTSASTLVCVTVLSNQGKPNGIALSPTEGRMYWTLETDGSTGQIRRAEMDGSNITLIDRELMYPYGITIDYPNSRLYWTDFGFRSIGTSGLDGSDSDLLIIKTSGWAGNWGIAVLNGRIYWGTWNDMTLESCDRSGSNFRIDYNGEKRIVHLVSTGMELPRNWTNHCASRGCSTVCVLTATSTHCLN